MIYLPVIVNPSGDNQPSVIINTDADSLIEVSDAGGDGVEFTPVATNDPLVHHIQQSVGVNVNIDPEKQANVVVGVHPIQMRATETHIQWRWVNDGIWHNLIELSFFEGEEGQDGLTPFIGENGNWWIGTTDTNIPAEGQAGKEVELRVSGGYIQWRYAGDLSWINLIATAELEGTDGKEIELQEGTTHIQWRYVGDTEWLDLIAIDDLIAQQLQTDWEQEDSEQPDYLKNKPASIEVSTEPNHIIVTNNENNIISVDLKTETVNGVGKQIIIEKDLEEKSYTIKLDETKIDHNNTLNYEPDRHRKMNYNEHLKVYDIEN